ncbi:MAG: hypothetical protein EB015_20000 [Methylocystaceae bacterium]|nr:hypothetical protein [Methylocystaceae bacterium]
MGRSFLIQSGLVLIALCAGADKGQADVLNMVCNSGKIDYQLILNEETGDFRQIVNNSETKLVLRSLLKENGTITAKGSVAGRGTDFLFVYKYNPQITFIFGNGGKKVEDCKLVSKY